MNSAELDFIYLIKCALHEQIPEKSRVTNMEMQRVYELCIAHNMGAMVAYALESISQCISTDIWKRFKNIKNKSIRRNILYDAECQKITAYMNEMGIGHLFVKGILLKKIYPQYGMREMADVDVLYDVSKKTILYDYMLKNGYQYMNAKDALGHYVEDIYHKAPIFNFEFHTRLFDKELTNEKIVNYYKNIWDRTKKIEGEECGYTLSPEDHYLYILAHAYKHFKLYGVGIRCLTDIYMLMEKNQLNWNYVVCEAEKMEIADFESVLRSISTKLFGADDFNMAFLTIEENTVLENVLHAGVYGNMDFRIVNRMNNFRENNKNNGNIFFTRIKYLCFRIFPCLDYMKFYSPKVKKHPWLVPFFYVQRLFRAVIRKRRVIKKELAYLNKEMKDEKRGKK